MVLNGKRWQRHSSVHSFLNARQINLNQIEIQKKSLTKKKEKEKPFFSEKAKSSFSKLCSVRHDDGDSDNDKG